MAIGDTDYASTLAVTDVVNSGTKAVATAVDNTGMSQGALYTLLNSIITNFNAMLVKVKADGAASTYSTYACKALASQGKGISANGMYQADLIATLTELETNFNAVLALLDADTQVTLTTYTAVATAAGSGAALNLNDTVVGSKGLSQDAIVSFLDDLVAKFNAVLANLDIDAL
jgi:hypothetical protein